MFLVLNLEVKIYQYFLIVANPEQKVKQNLCAGEIANKMFQLLNLTRRRGG